MAGRTQPIPKTGEEYSGRVVVTPGRRYTTCLCSSCGTVGEVRNNSLLAGKRCLKCVNKDKALGGRERWRGSVPAGMSEETFGRLWRMVKGAIRRCTKPDCPQWDDYGGRGITVWGPWVESRRRFFEHLASLQGHNDPSLWLDREDNDNGYAPGNLRFVTPSASARNRRSTKNRSTVCE